jgi:CubicO group peptidase (beta-lactamase class C family)
MNGFPLMANPDLSVGAGNKQGWNQPENRRAGFHGLHLLFRRALMVRSRAVLTLTGAPSDDVAVRVRATALCERPGFSALVVVEGTDILYEASAPDFHLDAPHSLQSVTKMHMHLIAGALVQEGALDLRARVERYLPRVGPGYRAAVLEDVLDMAVENDFTEDYADPDAACYAEEEALGWRLPPDGRAEPTLADFVAGLTGSGHRVEGQEARYKSANTDVLTLIAAQMRPLQVVMQQIADAAGYAGAFHCSLSPEGLPALSGGGCLSPRDLARFGLLIARGGVGVDGARVGDLDFLHGAMRRDAPAIPGRPGQRYSRHLMTDGRWVGHAGYGGQFLMIDPARSRVAAYLSVIENDSGYDAAAMRAIIGGLEQVLFDE